MNWCRREQRLCDCATSYCECMATACVYDLRLKEVNKEINNISTVKAIPIEWINNWLNKGRNAKYFIPMMELIEEWEKENESNVSN